MKYVIWGCGNRGKNIYKFMNGRNVEAFIDNNIKMQGNYYEGAPIISFSKYKEKYSDSIIIISPLFSNHDIEHLLDIENIVYLSSTILPPEACEFLVIDLFDRIVKKFETKPVVLYGVNLFSVLLMEYYMDTKEKYDVKIVPSPQDDANMVQRIKLYYSDKIIDIDEIESNALYLTSKQYYADNIQKFKLVNLYDFVNDIAEYYNPKIESFKNIHKGERCFIVATGPSLCMEDLQKLYNNNEICFSMNSIFKAFSNTKWRPNYYLLEDADGYKIWGDALINKYKLNDMFIADCCFENNESDEFIRFHIHKLNINEKVPPCFSNNFARCSYWGSTVTYACMQLAVYMGFSYIYLLGVDFDYGQNKKHFVDEYDLVDDQVLQLGKMKLAYESAEKYADENNIKIYNATRGGKLEVFERVDFDSLF